MRTNILLLVLTVLIGAGLTFWLDNRTSRPVFENVTNIQGASTTHSKLPEFSFTDIKGKKYSSTDFKGKILILNFWATWCAPCIIEFPKLIKLANDNKDIIVVALSSDIDDAKIRLFLKKQQGIGDNFIIARDEKRKITANVFGTYKLPETYIIGRSGEIIKKIVGDTDWNGEDIRAILEGLRKDSTK